MKQIHFTTSYLQHFFQTETNLNDLELFWGQVWFLAYLTSFQIFSFYLFLQKGGIHVSVRLLLLTFIFTSYSFSIIALYFTY